MASRLPPFLLRLRFATSAISTAILNLNAFNWLKSVRFLKTFCSPGFNCHGCPLATAACPVGVMTYGSALHAIPVFAIASVLAFAAILGRLTCAFLCPFGLIQDLLHKIPSPKIRLPRFFRYGKYAALLLLVIVLPFFLGFEHAGFIALNKPELNKADGGNISVKITVDNMGGAPVVGPQVKVSYIEKESKKAILTQEKSFPEVTVPPGQSLALPTFEMPNYLAMADLSVESPQSEVSQNPKYQLYYCKLCPAGTLTSTVPSYFSTKSARPWYRRVAGDWLRNSILVGFLVLMVISSRPFCRLFCPLGAIYALTARLSLSRMKLDKSACIDCGMCDKVCPMGLDVRKEVGGMECIACGDCRKVCPKSGIKREYGI